MIDGTALCATLPTVLTALAYQRSWSHDSLRRMLVERDVQAVLQWCNAYDVDGNRVSCTDPCGQSSLPFYDARDVLIRVTDPRSVITQYTYYRLDNLVEESCPGACTSAFSYGSARTHGRCVHDSTVSTTSRERCGLP